MLEWKVQIFGRRICNIGYIAYRNTSMFEDQEIWNLSIFIIIQKIEMTFIWLLLVSQNVWVSVDLVSNSLLLVQNITKIGVDHGKSWPYFLKVKHWGDTDTQWSSSPLYVPAVHSSSLVLPILNIACISDFLLLMMTLFLFESVPADLLIIFKTLTSPT